MRRVPGVHVLSMEPRSLGVAGASFIFHPVAIPQPRLPGEGPRSLWPVPGKGPGRASWNAGRHCRGRRVGGIIEGAG